MDYPRDFINKIICGNSVDVMKKIPSESIDLIVTSPPYNLKNSTGNGMKDGRGGKWKNAALELKMQASSIEILTIAAYYGSSDDPVYWQTQPDFVASKVADFNKLIDFKKDK